MRLTLLPIPAPRLRSRTTQSGRKTSACSITAAPSGRSLFGRSPGDEFDLEAEGDEGMIVHDQDAVAHGVSAPTRIGGELGGAIVPPPEVRTYHRSAARTSCRLGSGLNPDRAVLPVHEPASDEQSESRSVAADRPHRPLEHALAQWVRDAGPTVLDVEGHRGRRRRHVDVDR
jgi:hypothetical protein